MNLNHKEIEFIRSMLESEWDKIFENSNLEIISSMVVDIELRVAATLIEANGVRHIISRVKVF